MVICKNLDIVQIADKLKHNLINCAVNLKDALGKCAIFAKQ